MSVEHSQVIRICSARGYQLPRLVGKYWYFSPSDDAVTCSAQYRFGPFTDTSSLLLCVKQIAAFHDRHRRFPRPLSREDYLLMHDLVPDNGAASPTPKPAPPPHPDRTEDSLRELMKQVGRIAKIGYICPTKEKQRMDSARFADMLHAAGVKVERRAMKGGAIAVVTPSTTVTFLSESEPKEAPPISPEKQAKLDRMRDAAEKLKTEVRAYGTQYMILDDPNNDSYFVPGIDDLDKKIVDAARARITAELVAELKNSERMNDIPYFGTPVDPQKMPLTPEPLDIGKPTPAYLDWEKRLAREAQAGLTIRTATTSPQTASVKVTGIHKPL